MGMNSDVQPLASVEELEAYQIGLMVKAIQKGLNNPEDSQSLETIIEYGRDSRYYIMIRGWLLLELGGVESQYESTKGNLIQHKHKVRMDFLRKAIRAIDLE